MGFRYGINCKVQIKLSILKVKSFSSLVKFTQGKEDTLQMEVKGFLKSTDNLLKLGKFI